MSIRTELDKTALHLRNSRNAVIGRGGEISATAGFKDLPEAITNIPNDQTLAWQTVESNAKRVTVPSGVLPMAQIKKIGGMSYKSKNILKLKTLNETVNGVTITTNPDGSYTLNGTATEDGAMFNLWNYEGNWDIGGYKFPLGATISVQWQNKPLYEYPTEVYTVVWDEYDGSIQQSVYDNMVIGDLLEVGVEIWEGTVLDNVTFTIMINDGFTALPYETYFDGLRDSKTTSIVSEGANLLDISKAVNANFIDNGDGTYTLTHNGNTQRFSANMPLNIPANTPIAFKGITISGDARVGLDFKFADGTFSDSLRIDNYSRTRTYGKDIISARFYISSEDIGKSIICSNNQLVYGTTAKEYKPFVGTLGITNIPEAVRNLEGYGLGINADYYNYIEWRDSRCYFVQTCKKVVYDGTERWFTGGTSSNGIYRVYCPLPLNSAFVSNATVTPCICNLYGSKSPEQTYKLIEGASISATSVYIYDSRYITNDISLWKAYLAEQYAQGNPLTIIYALAEPIETDITDLMTVDNHIAVEGGGTVEFNNEYGYDIPNEINYLFNTAGG